jgi:cobalt-zinc-cadmium efflux system membrane fusion protein
MNATRPTSTRSAPPALSLSAARLAAGLALALLAACGPDAPPRAPEAGPSISGTTVRFARRPDGLRAEPVVDAGTTALTVPGRLAWDEDRTVRIFSPFAGRVIRPLAQVGDTVKVGQPLAELASSEFGQALADARRAETDQKLAEDSLARQRELYEAGLVAQKELRSAEAEQARAVIERQRAQGRLTQAGATGGTNFLLRAPIAGVVVERTLNPGQELRPDQGSTPLFVVTDPSRLWAWLDAPEGALPQVSPLPPGTALTLRSAAWGEREFEGRLVRKEDSIDPELRTLRMRASVANAQRLLKAGMYVTATFPLPPEAGSQLLEHVPVSAVLLVDGRRCVFVEDGERGYTRVEVRVVREQAGRAALLGLEPGQRVVVEGNLYLQQILARGGDPGAAAKTAAGAAPEGRK